MVISTGIRKKSRINLTSFVPFRCQVWSCEVFFIRVRLLVVVVCFFVCSVSFFLLLFLFFVVFWFLFCFVFFVLVFFFGFFFVFFWGGGEFWWTGTLINPMKCLWRGSPTLGPLFCTHTCMCRYITFRRPRVFVKGLKQAVVSRENSC